MRKYELVVIFRHENETYLGGLDFVRAELQKFGGTIEKEEDMGDRLLAYPIKKQDSGHYTLFYVQLAPQKVDDMGKILKLQASVLKFLFVLADEE